MHKNVAAAGFCRNFAAALGFHLLSQTVTRSRQISARCHVLFDGTEQKALVGIVLPLIWRYVFTAIMRRAMDRFAE
jgi:hypothetical protein